MRQSGERQRACQVVSGRGRVLAPGGRVLAIAAGQAAVRVEPGRELPGERGDPGLPESRKVVLVVGSKAVFGAEAAPEVLDNQVVDGPLDVESSFYRSSPLKHQIQVRSAIAPMAKIAQTSRWICIREQLSGPFGKRG